MYFVDLFKHYEAGFLLEPGAVNDQPAVYLDAMNALAGIKATIEKEQADDIKAQSRQNAKK